MAITKRKKKLIIILSIVLSAILLIVFLILPFTVASVVYNGVFGERYTTKDYLKFYLEDFEGLKAERHEFLSDGGEKLVGYRYYVSDTSSRGVVVIAHGFGGGGHNSYMDVAYYFAQNGYQVFAYDATGNDESEGEGTNGLPQGVKDLSSAISHLENIDELKNLPVMLWGHSWGAYSVSAVLNYHPEVKAVVSVAGFNQSSDLIRAQGEQMVGGIIGFLMPYVNSIEGMKFGDFASATAMDGFANTEAGIFIVHSSDDTVVPITYGYDIYYKEYKDDPRFKFRKFEDKGHNNIVYSKEYIDYLDEFNEEYSQHFGDKEPTPEEKSAYIKANLNREIYCNGLDKELFFSMLRFYDSYC